MEGTTLVARLTAWLDANPGTFTHRVDGAAIALVELASGHERALTGDNVEAIHERTNRATGVRYPILVLSGGGQLAITDLGFCFAPSFRSTGEIPGAPDVVSFGDFRRLYREAELAAEDPGRRKDALDFMMLCITIVDGARDTGFAVGREEDRLERLLRRIERGDTGPPAP